MQEQPQPSQQPQMTPEQLEALKEKIKNMSPEELREFQKKQCIFCQIIAGRVQSKKVYEDDTSVGILDINPANPGHVLLMTKEHYSIMPQIPDDELAHIFSISKTLSNAILRALEAEGTNIIVANGVVAGQRAQHFMLHIIPRKDNDNLQFRLPQKQLEQDSIDSVGEQIINSLNSVLGKEAVKREMAEPKTALAPKKVEFKEIKQDTKKPKPEKKGEGKKQRKKPEHKKEQGKGLDKEPGSGVNLNDIAKLLGGK